MKASGSVVVGFLLAFLSGAQAQVSGFASATIGHHNNPLVNYQHISDLIRQGYLELNYSKDLTTSIFNTTYVGGLMIFNRFTERNYYEHSLACRYTKRLSDPSALPSGHDGETDQEDETESDAEDSVDDSTSTYLDLEWKAGARHDKKAYQEFDNFGTDVKPSCRFMVSKEVFMRASNDFGYRRYTYLSELSNITNVLSFYIGNNMNTSADYGLQVAAGFKHYTTSAYDTSRFEPQRTFVQKGSGKGKGGANLKAPPSKKILTRPGSTTSYQLSATFSFTRKWNDGSLGSVLQYQNNLGSTTRQLAQYVNSSILSEDIYNDHFSYEGPGIQLTCKQTLPFKLTLATTVEIQRKIFRVPAFNIDGEEIGGTRKDLRGSAEASMSTYVELVDGIGLDVTVSASVLRNQSNDNYNDFSAFAISAALGIGF